MLENADGDMASTAVGVEVLLRRLRLAWLGECSSPSDVELHDCNTIVASAPAAAPAKNRIVAAAAIWKQGGSGVLL